MSWPQCRSCLHNRCDCCDYTKESADCDTEAAGDRSTAPFSKLNQLSGEIGLVLESLTLTSLQRKGLSRAWESLKVLNECISELEDAGAAEPEPETPAK